MKQEDTNGRKYTKCYYTLSAKGDKYGWPTFQSDEADPGKPAQYQAENEPHKPLFDALMKGQSLDFLFLVSGSPIHTAFCSLFRGPLYTRLSVPCFGVPYTHDC